MLVKPLFLFYTESCHLCEDAKAVFEIVAKKQKTINLIDWRLELVDIADDEALFEKYGVRIPVVATEDQELGWPFDEAQLDYFLTSQKTV